MKRNIVLCPRLIKPSERRGANAEASSGIVNFDVLQPAKLQLEILG
jgi:hypothetical protein